MREGSQETAHCTHGWPWRIPALGTAHWAAGLATEPNPGWPKARTLPATGTKLLWKTLGKTKFVLREENSEDPEEPGDKKAAGRPLYLPQCKKGAYIRTVSFEMFSYLLLYFHTAR